MGRDTFFPEVRGGFPRTRVVLVLALKADLPAPSEGNKGGKFLEVFTHLPYQVSDSFVRELALALASFFFSLLCF